MDVRVKVKMFFFIIFMKSYAIFNVTLINSEGTCQDYLGCLNATIKLKCCTNLQ